MILAEYPGFIYCDGHNCDDHIRSHAWGKITSGWFFQKDGKAYCPEHTPAWVENWRASKADVNNTKEQS